LERATLIGHSNSAAVALPFAITHLRQVERLVLVDPIGGDGPARLLLGVVLRRAIDAVLFELPISAAGWHHVAFNIVLHARNFWNQVRLAARTDLRETASRADVPTLLAWGARDHTMGITGLYELLRRIPHASVYVSESGSHDWIVAHPREFARMVHRFAMNDAFTPQVQAFRSTRCRTAPRIS
jgi:pimeloyl-ACP methyl ester carboxylesterase